ncbi:uncharacterized protein [Apostichopus japonicus]|uniref:uncharacterized protein isoform X2 n=1 Tax=Stichopus japonicus TaxID=307972 RepID=UPI003AB29F76
MFQQNGNTYIDGHYELNNNNVIEPFDNSTESQQLMNNKSHGPSVGYIDLDERIPDVDHIYDKLVIVTAFSQNHFMEAKGIIGTAQRQMPSKKIVVYDLGLNGETKKAVQSYCNVELRPFPFAKYPKFVSNLHVFSWKPIIIKTTLNEFGAIYWGDAAVRFKKSLKELIPYANNHHGYMSLMHSFDPKVHSPIRHQYYYTNKGMFEFLGINRTMYYQEHNASPHPTANRQLFINSTTLQTNIVQPLFECAMQYDCISPNGSKVGTHRFDASALALIIYQNLKYEWTPDNNDNNKFNEVIGMERSNGSKYKPRTCNEETRL